jgi:hypothetical protein
MSADNARGMMMLLLSSSIVRGIIRNRQWRISYIVQNTFYKERTISRAANKRFTMAKSDKKRGSKTF